MFERSAEEPPELVKHPLESVTLSNQSSTCLIDGVNESFAGRDYLLSAQQKAT